MKSKFMFYTPVDIIDFKDEYELLLNFIEDNKERYVIFHNSNLWVDELLTPDYKILTGKNNITNYFKEKGFDTRLIDF